MTPDTVFVQDGERYTATDLALGPWAPGMLHGGAPAALLMRAFTRGAEGLGLQPARVTYDFVRPAPQGPLAVEVQVVRPGRRVTLLDAFLRDGETVVTRARALLVAPSQVTVSTGDEPPPFPGPAAGQLNEFAHRGGLSFVTDGMEIRFVEGTFGEPGPATAWFRLRYPLLADETTSPLELLAAAGDFGNGIGSELRWNEHTFINPDLTLYIRRPPTGQWVALQSRMWVQPAGVSLVESALWDERGRIGRAMQSVLVSQLT